LVIAIIILPLRSAIRDSGRVLAVSGSIYFALIGVGFMMVEIGLLQRISIFLGHPVYALSVVLFSLILFTGLGSLLSERFALESPMQLVSWSTLTGIYLLLLPIILPQLLLQLESANLLVRAGFCVVVLAPAGTLMGFGFPTGMRLVSAIDPRPTPWFWGINGAAGVLASGMAVLTSIAINIDATLWVGAACYLLIPIAALTLASSATRTRGEAVAA
jgi:hypothetical protein